MTPTEIVRQFYAKLGEGDLAGLLALLGRETLWTGAAPHSWYRGDWTKPRNILETMLTPLGRDREDFSDQADTWQRSEADNAKNSRLKRRPGIRRYGLEGCVPSDNRADVLEVSVFVSEGSDVVVFGSYRGAREAADEAREIPLAHRWRVENGRIVGFVQYIESPVVGEEMSRMNRGSGCSGISGAPKRESLRPGVA